MFDFLRPHGLQHARLPCPPSPRVCSKSCPLSWWYHPTISSSVGPFSCLQSFSASGSFPVSQLFTSGGQSIGASASATGLISFRNDLFDLLAVQGTLKSLLQHHGLNAPILRLSVFFYCAAFVLVKLLENYWKNHSFDYMDLLRQSNVSAF